MSKTLADSLFVSTPSDRPCVRCGKPVAPFSHLWCAECHTAVFNGPLSAIPATSKGPRHQPGSRGTQR